MLRNKIGKLIGYSWSQRWLLTEAVLFLGAARLMIGIIPFRHLVPRLANMQYTNPVELSEREAERLNQIAWAVKVASHHTPWSSKCLVQAIAAKYMLRLRNLGSDLFLGVDIEPSRELLAHAWLECGSWVVTGAYEKERYKVVSVLADGRMSGDNLR